MRSIEFGRMFVMVLIVTALLGVVACGGSSDKDKAMALADEFEAVIDKYSGAMKKAQESGNDQEMQQVFQSMMTDMERIGEDMQALEGNLSESEKAEVEARFKEIEMKMEGMMSGVMGG